MTFNNNLKLAYYKTISEKMRNKNWVYSCSYPLERRINKNMSSLIRQSISPKELDLITFSTGNKLFRKPVK